MKRYLSVFIAAMVMVLGLGICAEAEENHGNYTDEMKIPYSVDLSEEDGADSVERMGDHVDSPYYSRLDFYNMTSNDTLVILPAFKTQQQTSEWSCGVTSALMAINYFGKLGDYNEESLAAFRSTGRTTGVGGTEPSATSLDQVIDIFEAVGGFELTTTHDLTEDNPFTLDMLRGFLEEGMPVLVCWNDWGGHWQVVIGYDTMGTETYQDDVLIVADPYDTTDHNQDGYGVYGAERFYYNFTTYNFFNDEDMNDQLFVAVKPAA